jgi:RNA polymerase-binding transcription factor DksA
MATKKAAKSAKKAPQPTKKAPAKKAAVKPVAKPAKKVAPSKAAPKKAAPVAKAKPSPVKGSASKAAPAKGAKPVAKPAPAKATPVKGSVKTAPAKVAPAKGVSKVAPAVPAVKGKAPVSVKGAPVKTPVVPVKAAPSKGAVAAKAAPVAAKATPAPAAAAKTPVAAPKPAPVAIKPSTVGVKPAEPKSTTIARPAPRPETKLVEIKPIKTSVSTQVKYEPDFTKSVLDDPGQTILNAPTMRYSDAELAEFKDLIMRKLEAAKKELTYLQGLITRKDEMGGDESENRYMTMEDGSISMEREQLSQMASRQIQFIDHLEKALMRIENKTYGICRVTGKLIDKARLRAVPHATLSIEAKMGLVKKSENQNVQ